MFEQVAGQKYRSADRENVRFGDLIKTTAHKLNSWAKQSLIQNFEFQLDRHWQWSGTFKSYLWVRIFREGDSRMVYFVVGLNWNGDL